MKYLLLLIFCFLCYCSTSTVTGVIAPKQYIFKVSSHCGLPSMSGYNPISATILQDSITILTTNMPFIVKVNAGKVVCNYRGIVDLMNNTSKYGSVSGTYIQGNSSYGYYNPSTVIYTDTFNIVSDTSWVF